MSKIPCCSTVSIALAIKRLDDFPKPIDRTSAFLSRAIRRLLRRGCGATESIKEVEIRLATKAREQHKSVDAAQKDVHKRHQPKASTPDGLAAPPRQSAVWRIICLW